MYEAFAINERHEAHQVDAESIYRDKNTDFFQIYCVPRHEEERGSGKKRLYARHGEHEWDIGALPKHLDKM